MPKLIDGHIWYDDQIVRGEFQKVAFYTRMINGEIVVFAHEKKVGTCCYPLKSDHDIVVLDQKYEKLVYCAMAKSYCAL
jgi:hypothetical protein